MTVASINVLVMGVDLDVVHVQAGLMTVASINVLVMGMDLDVVHVQAGLITVALINVLVMGMDLDVVHGQALSMTVASIFVLVIGMDLDVVHSVETALQMERLSYPAVEVVEEVVLEAVVLNCSAEASTTFLECWTQYQVACPGTAVHHRDH